MSDKTRPSRKFYLYEQVPVDKGYVITPKISHCVVIEAYNAQQANHTAQKIGIDFAESGRWRPATEEDGLERWPDKNEIQASSMVYDSSPFYTAIYRNGEIEYLCCEDAKIISYRFGGL